MATGQEELHLTWSEGRSGQVQRPVKKSYTRRGAKAKGVKSGGDHALRSKGQRVKKSYTKRGAKAREPMQVWRRKKLEPESMLENSWNGNSVRVTKRICDYS